MGKEGNGDSIKWEIKQKYYQVWTNIILNNTIRRNTSNNKIYGATEGALNEEVNKFYSDLQNILDKERELDERVIVMGDRNVRIGNRQNRKMGSTDKYLWKGNWRNGIKMLKTDLSKRYGKYLKKLCIMKQEKYVES